VSIVVSVLLSSPFIVPDSEGHRDGCHRWHSCPSDNGSYVCGDLGHDDECSGSEDEDDDDKKDSGRNLSNDGNNNNDNDDNNRDDDHDNNSNSEDNTGGIENNDRFTDTTLIDRNSFSSSNICLGNANCFTGTVSKVVDGDTVDVDSEIRIRLSLVNTPEQGEQGYQEAKDFVKSNCRVGTKVLVDEDDGQKAGSYGRMISLVYCGDDSLLLNQMLIEKGYAQIFEEYCERSEFFNLNWAQNNGC
jgi:endonuclease YncB( thermonuclease family)